MSRRDGHSIGGRAGGAIAQIGTAGTEARHRPAHRCRAISAAIRSSATRVPVSSAGWRIAITASRSIPILKAADVPVRSRAIHSARIDSSRNSANISPGEVIIRRSERTL